MALVRHDVRRRWREASAAALLIATGVAVVLVTVNVARRTDTAFDRFASAARAWDVLVNPDQGSSSQLDPTAIQRLPEVEDSGIVAGLFALPAGVTSLDQLDDLPSMLVVDGAVGYSFARPNVLEGRMPAPDAPDEIFVGRGVAAEKGLHVGDHLRIALPSREAVERIDSGQGGGGDAEAFLQEAQAAPTADLEVVGIGVTTDDFAFGGGTASDSALLTPAFTAKYLDGDALAHSGFYGVVVRLRPGADETAFRAEVQRLVPDEAVAFQSLAAIRSQAHRSTRPYSVALAASALVVAVLVAVVAALGLSRLVLADRRDHLTWWALGAVRAQRFAVLVTRALATVAVGVVVGLVVTVGLAGIKAIGPARLADPNHGRYLDNRSIWMGATGAAVVFGMLAASTAWRASGIQRSQDVVRPSKIGNWLAAASFPAPAVVGVRHALEPGRGRNRVPSRAVVVGSAAAVLVGSAALTFGAGMQQLTSSPQLYGLTWDRLLTLSPDVPVPEDRLDEVDRTVTSWVQASDDVSDAAQLWVSSATLSGRSVVTAAFEPVKGDLGPTLSEGRAPAADDEIALGRLTMRTLGAHVGDTIAATGADGSVPLKVTGVVVLPTLANYTGADKTALGEGAVVTKTTLSRLGSVFSPLGIAVDLPAGHTLGHLLSTAPDLGAPNPIDAQIVDPPTDVSSIARVRAAPIVLAGLVGIVAVVTIGEALFGAVRHRRRDLSILRALGFTSRQTARSVFWQAATIAVAASIIGIPLGAVVGRWWWGRLTGYLGGIDSLSLPVAALLLVALVTLAVCLVLAVVPARSTARMQPADVLRAE